MPKQNVTVMLHLIFPRHLPCNIMTKYDNHIPTGKHDNVIFRQQYYIQLSYSVPKYDNGMSYSVSEYDIPLSYFVTEYDNWM